MAGGDFAGRAAAVLMTDIYHPAQQANIDVRLQLNAHDVIRTDSRTLKRSA
ncbi:hypothetical protein KCP75_16775 [Salmonella enterica subsp. enterica]|nr:hypothetical protein KCP75_16775 [Salmonella enterica subsp. enterica]